MKHINLITSFALAITMALPAFAEALSLDQISKYLNTIKSAQSPFTQLNADGSQSSGVFYIHRPGRLRFEYAAPDNSLVMAGGGMVAIFDPKSNQPPEQYPIKRTPLNLILERKVDLAKRNMVVGHTTDGTMTYVTAQDPENPEYGTIQLAFSADPIALQHWVIDDGAGNLTTVKLSDLEIVNELSSFLFNITFESDKRGF
jgi:outer membrane lipoprotein-sorting protein